MLGRGHEGPSRNLAAEREAGGPGGQVENAGITPLLGGVGQTVAPTVSWIPHLLVRPASRSALLGNAAGIRFVWAFAREARPILRAPEAWKAKGLTEQDEEELEEEPELDEDALEEEPEIDEELDEDLDDTELADTDTDTDTDVVAIDADPAAPAPAAARPETGEEEEETVLDLDEELHPDDVEEPLDVLLKERTAAATLEDDEEEVEEEEVETDERGEAPARILPRRPGEFLCQSCFLVLPRNQLADEKRMYCRDCA
jgi:Domain of unknown function (DUF4193)